FFFSTKTEKAERITNPIKKEHHNSITQGERNPHVAEIAIDFNANFQQDVSRLAECVTYSGLKTNWSEVATCSCSFNERWCEEIREEVPYDEYDLTINKDWSDLTSLGENGWKVQIGESRKLAKCYSEEHKDKCLEKVSQGNGSVVFWMGSWNAGKRTLLQRLTGKNYPLEHGTKGIHFVFDEDSTKTIHVGAFGLPQYVASPSQLSTRAATDLFVDDVLLLMSNI
ncbi:hypothetical protein RFI_05714, partial [Reticulomyxa filosa]